MVCSWASPLIIHFWRRLKAILKPPKVACLIGTGWTVEPGRLIAGLRDNRSVIHQTVWVNHGPATTAADV